VPTDVPLTRHCCRALRVGTFNLALAIRLHEFSSSGSLDDAHASGPLRPRRGAVLLLVLVFTGSAVFILYEGITTGDYLLVALVVIAYMFVLMLEARLSLRPPEPVSKPAKKPRAAIRGDA